MGVGGGLQATDLRRRLVSQRSRSRRNSHLLEQNAPDTEESIRCNGDESPVVERSGQPTCIGYKRKDNEEGEEEISDETLRLSDVVTAELKSRLSVGSFGDPENDDETGNRRKGNNERRNRFRWYFKDLWRIVGMASRTLFLGVVLLVTPGLCHQDAQHITAILGESVVFNCHVEFPEQHAVPYVLQWEKKVGDTVRYRTSPSLLSIRELKKGAPFVKGTLLVPATAALPENIRNKFILWRRPNESIDEFLGQEIPIYIWYESYPTHSGEGYEGRVSRVSPKSPYGDASLNLTNIRETDQGWYECKVVFLNRPPNTHKNGTWFHLDVHAPPRFSITPEEIIYVNLGDAIILNCQAEGTPTPEILWYKDAHPVEISTTIGIFNDGTELRISTIRNEDIGDYTCIARNGEGQISHTARVIIAGGAVIMVPPTNQTKLEGEKVQFSCEAKALPGNVTVRWFREGALVTEVSALDTRASVRMDGSLVINPVSAEDSGQYLCEVTNGIGEPQAASAYLNVEYPAKVTFTPTVQYLPFRLGGVVQCYVKANPPVQYVTWTKDKRLLEPYQTKDIVVMNNGSLLFTRVNENHQGKYTCTPYNAQGTQGSSGQMEVLVRNPPVFTIEPEPTYQKKVGETVEMHCDAQEGEGTQKPSITWQRKDGTGIQRNRAKIVGGNLTIESLRRQDFGYYQCVASNEVATITASTQLIIEGTQPHAPFNITGTASEFSVNLSWSPGYSGGPDYKQDYTVWYREANTVEWTTIPVTPSGSTSMPISNLTPGTAYEFQVFGKNALGEGVHSNIFTIKTLDVSFVGHTTHPTPRATEQSDILDYNSLVFPTDSTGNTIYPRIMRPKGPKPGPPRNVTVREEENGFIISWQHPAEKTHLVQYYTIRYRTDGPWKDLNKARIRPEDTFYLVKNLVGGRTYHFQVFANSSTNYGASEEVKFPVPARVKHKAITAGVVGGILFFIVAIILSICAVKICNKRKRRKQEKELLSAYNMVACRVTDARNGAGQGPQGTVPLKKPRQSRVPGLSLLREILNADTPDSSRGRPLGKISRAADGRFVISDSALSSANNSILDASSSDDGGFLPKTRLKSSWRQPLVGMSQLSLRSDGSGVSIGVVQPGHLGSVTPLVRQPTICTISSPRFLASSPSGAQIPWTPVYLSDLSSVRQPSSGERSFPTPPGYVQLRSVHQRYSQELPSLKAIHAESRRFVPVQPLATSSPPQTAGRPRARLPPRHARHARSAPELAASPDLETSPESRSSSSGFGSKNTSQQNQSSRSGSTVAEWRPPPYRPPPPPLVGRWLELQNHGSKASHTHIQNAVDAGSVDGHYEFDPVSCTPTPTSASTPTREERPPAHQMHTIHMPQIHQVHTVHHQPARYSRDNIEARVQAMKAEFHQFRQRQARRKQSVHLESAC